MTLRLYQDHVYLKECLSTVLAITNDNCLVLNKSLFFPTGGGQPCDLGTINDLLLAEVFEKSGEVYHRFQKAPPFKVGDEVTCKLDWDLRFDHMQRHCGEHILSGIFFSMLGGVNRGFHMGNDYMTIDIDLPAVTMETALRVELASNEVIWSDVPVSVRYFSRREEAEKLPLRKEITVEKDISVVCVGAEANPADCVACCGTHPSTSGQIGLIKLLKIENYKGMSRVYFESGKRAFLHTVKEHQLISALAEKYSADENTLGAKISAQEDKNQLLRQDLQKYRELLIEREVQALCDATSLPSEEPSSSPQVIVKEYEHLSLEDLQQLAKALSAISPNFFILIALNEKALLISRAINTVPGAPDFGGLIKANVASFNGKGGGNSSSARAAFQSLADLDEFVQHTVGLLIDGVEPLKSFA